MIPKGHEHAERVLGLIPINNLGEYLQHEVLDQGELVEFKRRKVVFEAGDRDPYTFYLITGEVELESDGIAPSRVAGGQESATRALAQLQPRRYTAKTLSKAVFFRIERAVLDRILSDDQMLGDGGVVEVGELDVDEDDGDWMTRLLTSPLFADMPPDNIQRFFSELEPVVGAAGDVLVEQGASGAFLYIVSEGRCAVTRRSPGGGEVQLAVLKAGDSFGEESLVSNSRCNASVKMLTDGFVMRLAKRSFEELVSKRVLKALTYSEACAVVESGGAWLDVRFADEHQTLAIEGSLSVPLNTLRTACADLDRSRTYVLYCDSGARSSSAAFLLTRLGFDACYLAGGLDHTPLALGDTQGTEWAPESDVREETDRGLDAGTSEVAPAPVPDGTEVPRAPAGAPAPAAGSGDAATSADAEHLAKLQAGLAATVAERDKALARLKHGTEAFQELKRRYEKVRAVAKAEQERRKVAEAEVATIKAEAERQIGMETKRLEGELEKAAERLTASQEQGKNAVEHAESERVRLAAELEESRQRAESLRAEQVQAEEARAAAAAAAEQIAQGATDQLRRAEARVEQAEQEIETLRGELSEVRASTDEVRKSEQDQQSALELAAREVERNLRAENERLEAACTSLESELASIASGQQETEARLREERQALESGTAGLQARIEELDRLETDLEHARKDVETTLQQREESLERAQTSLAAEKSDWQAQVEEAIVGERERLAASYAQREQEIERAAEEQAREIAEQQVAELRAEWQERESELRAELEAREAQVRAETEAQAQAVRERDIAEVRSQLEKKVAQVELHYKTKLLEQEAVLEDERRRIELEGVRLREALEEAQRIIKDVEAVQVQSPPDVPVTTSEVLDLEVEGPAPSVPPPPKPRDEPQVPQFEFIDDDLESATMAEEDLEADVAQARVLDPKQIAALRKQMEQKMRAKRAS